MHGQLKEEDTSSNTSNQKNGVNESGASSKSARKAKGNKRTLIESLNLAHQANSNNNSSAEGTGVSGLRVRAAGSILNLMGERPKGARMSKKSAHDVLKLKFSGHGRGFSSLASLLRTKHRINKFRKKLETMDHSTAGGDSLDVAGRYAMGRRSSPYRYVAVRMHYTRTVHFVSMKSNECDITGGAN
jgi:hypothetical protein